MLLTLLVISALVFLIIKLPPGDLPLQPDRRAARAGRRGGGRQGRVPARAVRPRPAGLGAIPRPGSASWPGPNGFSGPAAGRLGLVLRVPAAGQRGRRRRARPDDRGQYRGGALHPHRRHPDRDLLGDAAIFCGRLRGHAHRLYRPRHAQLPAGADPALLPQPLVRHLHRRHDGPAIRQRAHGRWPRSGSIGCASDRAGRSSSASPARPP